MFETVPGQAEYGLPSDFVLPRRVVVDGRDFDNASLSEVRSFEAGVLSPASAGVWYLKDDLVGLWQTPTEVVPVELEYVFQPVELGVPSDVPSAFPESFHPALLFYVKAVYYADVEDNPELEASNRERWDAEIAKLKVHGTKRKTGDGSFRIGLSGVTA